MDDVFSILQLLWESNVLLIVFIIIPVIVLLGSWVFGSRIGDDVFGDKYLKESFDSFKTLMIFYFSAILFVILFVYLVK
mgnify:FL=1|jgi:hypothetical protein|tara:strand:+ start:75 stop:311 length:237 start_codon:yes stop_codon:yes gene_type:complete